MTDSNPEADIDPEADIVIDARGLMCPMPVISLGRAAKSLVTGLIRLRVDDPAALVDVPAWCQMRSAELLSTTSSGPDTEFLIRLAGTEPT